MARQKVSSKTRNSSAPARLPCPAISVIVPMYNVEKYVGECLDSLLAQTFQDFEVIAIDDCSTDNSILVVESYAGKFNGRLKITKMKRNTGGGGIPRDKGISISRGEYVFLLDADDTITKTALEELYSHAKNFNADVVHCERYYMIPDAQWNNREYRKQIQPYSYKRGDFITAPLLITNDISERITLLSEAKIIWNAGGKFIRRDFINESELKFCNAVHEDLAYTMCTICSAKNYLVIPNIFYYYRLHEGSIINPQLDLPQYIHRQISSLKIGVKYLDDFFSDYEIFSQRLDLKNLMLDMFTKEVLGRLYSIYQQAPFPILNELLRREFDGENSALKLLCFNKMIIQQLQIVQMQNQFNQFAAQAQQRIAQLENELNNRIR